MDLTLIIVVVLFLIGLFVAYWIGSNVARRERDRHWENELPIHRKDAIMKSRAVLAGHFSEQLAPFLPDFPFNANECRFIGKPIDFLVFKGMDDKDISEVIFVEVKSGKSKLNSNEKKLKEAIENKKVSWMEYRVSEDLTKKREDSDDMDEI
ncbi:MAG: Holliday junction resolvase-like protein [Candidatus Pacearchaeota archaeon]|nr:Holliday junction resolvase-like protein [Candidatus Pacearchaeota archaeon]